MKIEWNKVTWYSWTLTAIVFGATIYLGFYFLNDYKEIENYSGSIAIENLLETGLKSYSNRGTSFKYPAKFVVITGYDEPYSKNIQIYLDASSSPCHIVISSNLRAKTGPESGEAEILSFSDYVDFMNRDQVVYDRSNKISTVNGVLGAGQSGWYIFPYLDDRVIHVWNDPGFQGQNINLSIIRQKCDPIVDQIVKTLKIPVTSSALNTDTSNWKTYKNEKYGFEFKYPRYWGDMRENYEMGNGSSSQSDYLVWFVPNNTLKPDVKIIVRNGVDYTKLGGKDFIINGYRAQSSKEVYPVRTDKDGLPVGYYEQKVFYIEKSPNVTVIVIIESPKFRTEADVAMYNTPEFKEYDINDFDRFLSTFKFTK